MEQEFIVEIEELSNLGAGIAKHEGKVIFVENTCPGDRVKIKITKQNKTYSFGQLVEIINPSKHRVKPFCPMQKVCGACQIQFIDYKEQLKIKQQIVKDYSRNLNLEVGETVPSPEIKGYRHKIQYPVSETKNSKRIIAGYYKPKSHEIVNIKYCPIQPEICDEIIDYIRENASKYNISGYREKSHSGILKHIVIRSSAETGNNLLVMVINDNKISKQIKQFGEDIYNRFDKISGVCVNFNNKKTNLILSDKTQTLCGEGYIEEKLCGITFKIGANTFFQVNPKSAENIFQYVKQYIKENFESPTILDAYAGIAVFGIVMSNISQKVVSVEENQESISLAKEVLELNKIHNVDLYAMDTAKYLETTEQKFDVTILDPPRKGCTQESLDGVLKVTKSKIIYVSCNPQTLARDLEYLISKGGKVNFIQPFDMFCHTYHVESVAVIDLE